MLAGVVDDALAGAGVRHDEYNVLRILRGAGAVGRTLGDVRERMVRDTGRLQALAHGLRQRGLVGGALTLAITAAGLEQLAAVDGRVDRAIRAQMARIEPAKLRTAVEVLEAMRGHAP